MKKIILLALMLGAASQFLVAGNMRLYDPAQAPDIIKFHENSAGKISRQSGIEFLDLDKTESITLEKFIDLVLEKNRNDIGLIVAIVTTKNSGVYHHYYYEATGLNEALFGKGYTYNRYEQTGRVYKNPETNGIIVGEIKYVLLSNPRFNRGIFLGTDYDLLEDSAMKESLRTIFKPGRSKQKAQAFADLATIREKNGHSELAKLYREQAEKPYYVDVAEEAEAEEEEPEVTVAPIYIDPETQRMAEEARRAQGLE